jgi:hypothetical protein
VAVLVEVVWVAEAVLEVIVHQVMVHLLYKEQLKN